MMCKMNNKLIVTLAIMSFFSMHLVAYADGLTIEPNGRVDIGRSEPSVYDFSIHDDIGGAYQHMTTEATGQTNLDGLVWGIDPEGQAYLINRENKDFVFYTNNTPRVTIKNDGKFGIGRTEEPIYNFSLHGGRTAYLHLTDNVTGQEWTDGLVLGFNSVGTLYFLNRENTNTNFYTDNSLRMVIQNDGKVAINKSTASYNLDVNGTARVTSIVQSSDKRLKKDIQPVKKSLDKLAQIRGVSYKWNNLVKSKKVEKKSQKKDVLTTELNTPAITEQVDDRTHMGLLAQEVEQVFPEAVYTDEDGMKSIAYSQLIGPLVEAVKELNEKVKRLEKENKNQAKKLTA